ncbi:HEPN domain-containing protein [Tranquillimonas rosea]|uniref:HEPN domain-containing protein n=1 Tax=Tranquillimonas rosea TaxID=641238 RepID=UPI0011608AC4|nr:HEPN domain-containing protein [Tranquillimonas rosea]
MEFRKRIEECRERCAVFEYLDATVTVPIEYSDILRAQVVNIISALDTYVHNIVQLGVMNAFHGKSAATSALLNEKISVRDFLFVAGQVDSAEQVFSDFIKNKTGYQSFQSPDSISAALALVSAAPNKWKLIADEISLSRDTAISQLNLIVQRRNGIAHECDIDPISGDKFPLTLSECRRTVDFVASVVDAIESQIGAAITYIARHVK